MNTIILEKDKINISNPKIKLNGNKIIIKSDMELLLEYDSSLDELIFDIESSIKVKMFVFASNLKLNTKMIYNIAQNSSLEIIKFYNNNTTNEEVIINLNGANAKVNYQFSAITNTNDLYKIVINHNYSNTYSNITNHNITLAKSNSVFTIDSNLAKGNKKCILKQATKVITMDKNNTLIKPNMYIEEHDVEAVHSSVVGKISKNDIFYLMSRGIDYQNSIKLLVKGFLIFKVDINIKFLEKILKVINNIWR